ncbi:MAG: hypothetical protein J7623_17085 [Chitinophaga sp.]|uniref:carbamoyltransferase family protein n=1 Tax=Chitinophaga sp. TaxID=1869181 RepID=UPI001B0C5EAA|nr:carbamoyltransferase C-terminal domain-containing protein [Chitinophaga sp.]MBO9730358.1 hypothetical protein [Chitinophaga sp.]
MSLKRDSYIIGSGLTHDGSVCLMKNGSILVAVEKERITRLKHDGLNDADAIDYCLHAAGITLHDIDLVVQNSNYGFFEYGNGHYHGPRHFTSTLDVPVVTISHHLAHAYYGIGSSPYDQSAVLVLDGCGSLYDECIDLKDALILPDNIPHDLLHLYVEKDSFYHYHNNQLSTICKDFSPFGLVLKEYPMHPTSAMHSIGGVYASITAYCFANGDDTGKLMGLAPYGKPGVYDYSIFELKNGRVFVNYDWMKTFRQPVRSQADFWNNFQYYADIAYWAQKETERAILYLIRSRKELTDADNLCYTGGVALNAVANAKILKENIFKNVYFTPAAGDNGLAIGCAYYGWLEVLKRERIKHNGSSCFGKVYSAGQIKTEISNFVLPDKLSGKLFIDTFFEHLPFFFRKEETDKEQFCMQFVISGVGNFSFLITPGKVSVNEDASLQADCVFYADSITFINAVNDSATFFKSKQKGNTFILGDFGYFLRVIRMEELVATTRKLSQEQPAFKKIHFSEESDVFAATARLLADGKVIGWFQDGCEFGPRALGNRSILADPRKAGVQKFINNKVKFREDFRPFAPAVLKEHVSDYFEFEGDSPYMILVAPVKQEWKDKIAGVVHVDNSCRIQTVTSESSPKFYQLIREFKSLTDIPVLLNTSFNKKGMPIVETPSQALSYFFECALDCLVIDNYIITKELNEA